MWWWWWCFSVLLRRGASGLQVGYAQWRDLAGMSGVVCEAFGSSHEPRFVSTIARRSAWMVAFGRRLGAVERGDLRPHALLVARDAFGVVGVSEIGLLPAPPGVNGLPSLASELNAEWRGVALSNVIAFANDVPTIANVAVAKRARRKRVGTGLVRFAQRAILDHPNWSDYRTRVQTPKLYARVTDPQALRFWAACGFRQLGGRVSDVRGQSGVWLARDLAST